MKLATAMGRAEDVVSHEEVCATCGVGPCECPAEMEAPAAPARASVIERVKVAVLTWYFRRLRTFIRFLIRVIFWRKKEQDEDDYLHEGQVMELERIPLRSTNRDGKRAALSYARQRTKNPRLTWGQARKRLRRWEREEREANARGPGRPDAAGVRPAERATSGDARGARRDTAGRRVAAAGVGA